MQMFPKELNSEKPRNMLRAYSLVFCVTLILSCHFVGCSKPIKRGDSILLNESISLDYISDAYRSDSAVARLKSVGLEYEYTDASGSSLSRVDLPYPIQPIHLGKAVSVKNVKMFGFESGVFYMVVNRVMNKYIDSYYFIKGGLSNQGIYKGADAFDSLSHGEYSCFRFDGVNGSPNRVSGHFDVGLYSISLSSLKDTIIYSFVRTDLLPKLEREREENWK